MTFVLSLPGNWGRGTGEEKQPAHCVRVVVTHQIANYGMHGTGLFTHEHTPFQSLTHVLPFTHCMVLLARMPCAARAWFRTSMCMQSTTPTLPTRCSDFIYRHFSSNSARHSLSSCLHFVQKLLRGQHLRRAVQHLQHDHHLTIITARSASYNHNITAIIL